MTYCTDGYTDDEPSSYFDYDEDNTYGIKCYKVIGCATDKTEQSKCSGTFSDYKTSGSYTCGTCTVVEDCPDGYYEGVPNSTYFSYTTTTAGTKTCYKASCKVQHTSYNPPDGASAVAVTSQTYNGLTCYRATGSCNSPYVKTCSTVTTYDDRTFDGVTCWECGDW